MNEFKIKSMRHAVKGALAWLLDEGPKTLLETANVSKQHNYVVYQADRDTPHTHTSSTNMAQQQQTTTVIIHRN